LSASTTFYDVEEYNERTRETKKIIKAVHRDRWDKEYFQIIKIKYMEDNNQH
jgi:hypothetical protein